MTTQALSLTIAKAKDEISLLARMANRHGLIAGATGTGKTVTLRVMAEAFSKIGVPVFMADVKGDLSGLAVPGVENTVIADRIKTLRLTDFAFAGHPTLSATFLENWGFRSGTTISEMGPLLLSRILDLNETQSGVLNLVFKIADDNGLLLLDLKDLRAMVQFAGDQAEQFRTEYGNISAASIGAIQTRNLLAIEEQGA